MAAANYKQIPSLLRARAEFEGNSMSAGRTRDGRYEVFSYATIIAEVLQDGTAIFNDHKYSKTTSRHQKLCHENL